MFGISDFTKPIIDYANFEFSDLLTALGFGGAIVLIGMATIFAVLCILWLCLTLFKVFFHDIPEKKAQAAAQAPVVTVQENEVQETSDSEIIAVIAAAIAMAESESNGVKFNVVSFRRK